MISQSIVRPDVAAEDRALEARGVGEVERILVILMI